MNKNNGLRFYCIDDDREMIAVIKALLESEGHSVDSNTSPTDALEQVEANPPDCILIDLMMPEKDGLELCGELRSKEVLDDTKIIVVTGKAYEFDRKRAFNHGADGYIIKPINEMTFVNQVLRIMEDRIELTFWGVRGTLPVTGEKSLRYGGNTPCISLEFAKGQFFIFDAGSGIKSLSDRLMAEQRRRLEAKIFISHPHWDHINALPFFVPLYMSGNEFEILGASHGSTTMREVISAQMDDIYFPITIKEFGARVYFKDLREGEFEIDDITINTMLLNHPGNCLGYRINYNGSSFCYITDNELYLESDPMHNPKYVERLAKFIEGTDALVTDVTYTDEEYKTKVNWGHSCISQVIDLADRAKVKTLYLFHHDPDQDDDAIDNKLKIATEMLKERGSKVECLAPSEGIPFQL